MAVWKVLFIGVLACVCMSLGVSVFVVPFNYTGGERWLWLLGMIAATAGAGGLFALFMRYASIELQPKKKVYSYLQKPVGS